MVNFIDEYLPINNRVVILLLDSFMVITLQHLF